MTIILLFILKFFWKSNWKKCCFDFIFSFTTIDLFIEWNGASSQFQCVCVRSLCLDTIYNLIPMSHLSIRYLFDFPFPNIIIEIIACNVLSISVIEAVRRVNYSQSIGKCECFHSFIHSFILFRLFVRIYIFRYKCQWKMFV